MGIKNQMRIENDTSALNVLRQAALKLQGEGKTPDLVACSAMLVALDIAVANHGRDAAMRWVTRAAEFLLGTYHAAPEPDVTHRSQLN
jgi:hypothetical protein